MPISAWLTDRRLLAFLLNICVTNGQETIFIVLAYGEKTVDFIVWLTDRRHFLLFWLTDRRLSTLLFGLRTGDYLRTGLSTLLFGLRTGDCRLSYLAYGQETVHFNVWLTYRRLSTFLAWLTDRKLSTFLLGVRTGDCRLSCLTYGKETVHFIVWLTDRRPSISLFGLRTGDCPFYCLAYVQETVHALHCLVYGQNIVHALLLLCSRTRDSRVYCLASDRTLSNLLFANTWRTGRRLSTSSCQCMLAYRQKTTYLYSLAVPALFIDRQLLKHFVNTYITY